ncbi:hypothetical protein [Herbiconiux sp.]|uniref:hypothetical protein n=1 Tax=Herbiconiux sp. TaxID=1871186 RepID=UPI0025BE827D|nr:hypothetical protein [Herbiconiux sp.]
MIWGPSKKFVQEQHAAKARMDEQHDRLIEKLSHMDPGAAENYLVQTRLFNATKAAGYMINAYGERVDILDVVREAEHRAAIRAIDERGSERQAQAARQRRVDQERREQEQEQEEARQRARDLRLRLQGAQGQGKEDVEVVATRTPIEPRKSPDRVAAVDSKWETDMFHIDPRTGSAHLCTFSITGCPFAAPDFHFDGPDQAQAVWRRKQQLFQDWVDRSSVPQAPGQVTQHVFDPGYPETYDDYASWLRDFGHPAAEGTRLVLENGWVFEKFHLGTYWTLIAGEEVPGVVIGKPLLLSDVYRELLEHGGRLEFREHVSPMRLPWALNPSERNTQLPETPPPSRKPWWKR